MSRKMNNEDYWYLKFNITLLSCWEMAGKHTIMEEKDLELIVKYKSIKTLLFIKADFLELDIEENSL